MHSRICGLSEFNKLMPVIPVELLVSLTGKTIVYFSLRIMAHICIISKVSVDTVVVNFLF